MVYLSDAMIAWLIIGLAFLLLEMGNPGATLFLACFAAAFMAALASYVVQLWFIQVGIFFMIAMLLFRGIHFR